MLEITTTKTKRSSLNDFKYSAYTFRHAMLMTINLRPIEARSGAEEKMLKTIKFAMSFNDIDPADLDDIAFNI